eukprot:403359111
MNAAKSIQMSFRTRSTNIFKIAHNTQQSQVLRSTSIGLQQIVLRQMSMTNKFLALNTSINPSLSYSSIQMQLVSNSLLMNGSAVNIQDDSQTTMIEASEEGDDDT